MAPRKSVKTTTKKSKTAETKKTRSRQLKSISITEEKIHPITINMHLEKLDSGHITHIGNIGDLRQAVENTDEMIKEFFTSFIEKFKNDVRSGQIVSVSISCK